MFKEKIKEKEYVLGTWCEIPTAYSVNVIAKAKMDFVIIDMEHGVVDFNSVQNMVLSAESECCSTLIRVPRIDESFILRALDTGADGIIVPQVESSEDVKQIIKYSKYCPDGNRGFNPYVRAGGYTGVDKNYLLDQNKKTTIGIILESKNAFDNIEEIIAHPLIDIVYIGQYDLSVALGVPGDVTNEVVVSMLNDAVKTINRVGKLAGCMVHSIDEANTAIERGIRFIVYKVDTGVMFSAYDTFKKGVR